METPLSAIVLAAGHSRRMGRSKPLLPLGERTFIAHCIQNLSAAGCAEILTVIRGEDAPLAQALSSLTTSVVFNPDPESEMSDSLRWGLRSIHPYAERVLVALADHPLVTVATLRRLASHPLPPEGGIVLPCYRGRRGHPPLLSRQVLAELDTLPTLREVIRRTPGRVTHLETDDPAVLLDLDTPQEYRSARLHYEAPSIRRDLR